MREQHTNWLECATVVNGSCNLTAKQRAGQPLTDSEMLEMWRVSAFRGNGGQADWFAEGIKAAERAHGIRA